MWAPTRLARLRTWVEFDASAARRNIRTFRHLIGPRVRLWAVVKSNAYGHGLLTASRIFAASSVDGFCVDSVVEAASLRRAGIRGPILVLGPTLSSRFSEAHQEGITVSASTLNDLKELARLKHPPRFHLKIDTGMHRRGLVESEWGAARKMLARHSSLRATATGIFSHLAAAKNKAHSHSVEAQARLFERAIKYFHDHLAPGYLRHFAATAGTLSGTDLHYDAVRIGIGLYGHWPSPEFSRRHPRRMTMNPVLSWRSVITETKRIPRGARVGYDLTWRASRPADIAVVPVGYWHGVPRALSNRGTVIVRGRRVPIVGRVSMDMIVVDVTGVRATMGERVTLIGRDGRSAVTAEEWGDRVATTPYEILTRLNPLMERIVTND